MENRQLFLRVLKDLEGRLQSDDEYDVLNIARLLRTLLIDGTALVHSIISDMPFRLVNPWDPPVPKLQFEVGDYTVPPKKEGSWWAMLDGFDPNYQPECWPLHGKRTCFCDYISVEIDRLSKGQRLNSRSMMPHVKPQDRVLASVTLGKDHFLSREVMHYENESFSVKDVIKQLANMHGAVHFARSKKPRDQALDFVTQYLRLDGMPIGVYALLPIGRVAFRSLQPFKEHIEKTHTFERAYWGLQLSENPDGTATLQATPSSPALVRT